MATTLEAIAKMIVEIIAEITMGIIAEITIEIITEIILRILMEIIEEILIEIFTEILIETIMETKDWTQNTIQETTMPDLLQEEAQLRQKSSESTRKPKLKEYFADKNNEFMPIYIVRPKSDFAPKSGRVPELDDISSEIEMMEIKKTIWR